MAIFNIVGGGGRGPIVNKNLLDNWDFAINQRGKIKEDDYIDYGVYSNDRWILNGAEGRSGYIRIYHPYRNAYISQRLEDTLRTNLFGRICTASVLVKNISGSTEQNAVCLSSQPTVFSDNVVFMSMGNIDLFMQNGEFFILTPPGNNMRIAAVKLELGSHQTLAHQENGVWVLSEVPDYAAELLKCQRYFQRFASQGRRPTDPEDFRPVLRTPVNGVPAMGTITVDGKTYYTASADL